MRKINGEKTDKNLQKWKTHQYWKNNYPKKYEYIDRTKDNTFCDDKEK